jgi:hypothetical protein
MAKATEQDIDEMIKYFQAKEDRGTRVPCGWRRVVYGMEILVNDVCDPAESHLAYSPYLEEFHVAPEM